MTAKTSVNVEYHKHGEEGYDIRNLYSGYNWTGKEVKPDVLIRCADCNKELKEGTDYKLEYKNNVNVGTATVKVVGMGAYKGVDQLILRSKKIVDGMVSSIIMTRIRMVIISEVLNGVNGDIIKKLHISLLHVIIAEKNWKMEKIIRSHSLIQIIQEKVQQKLWD